MSQGTVEQRLDAVESAVADLRTRLEQVASPPSWIERVTGSFKDEPAFDEVLDLGRALRQADRPADPADEG